MSRERPRAPRSPPPPPARQGQAAPSAARSALFTPSARCPRRTLLACICFFAFRDSFRARRTDESERSGPEALFPNFSLPGSARHKIGVDSMQLTQRQGTRGFMSSHFRASLRVREGAAPSSSAEQRKRSGPLGMALEPRDAGVHARLQQSGSTELDCATRARALTRARRGRRGTTTTTSG